ncbi:uncharacterized protein [Clytia hemisphaerica]|uniref:uncharacterized protein n=1 Tax=Clytia hemisphaerica TaxID=252671 RepID=UPI0034D4877D
MCNPNVPPIEPVIPISPFEAISSDYFKLHGHWYLVIVDRFSNWPHITKVEHNPTTIGSKGLIRALKRFFATFGVPQELSSDGGPEFTANETEDFLKRWGVHHRLSSAYNPRSNGRAEVAVKAMKRLLRDNIAPNGNIDTESFTRAILQFRNTPDPSTGTSPAEVIFGRPLRDVLPVKPPTQLRTHDSVKPSWKHLWRLREEELLNRSAKQMDTLTERTRPLDPLHIGDTCRIQNQTGRYPRQWHKLGMIVEVGDNDQYIIRVLGSNQVTLRNRKHLKKVNSHPTFQHPIPLVVHPLDESNQTPTPTAQPTFVNPEPTINHSDAQGDSNQQSTNDTSETVVRVCGKGMNSTPIAGEPNSTNQVQPGDTTTNEQIQERPKRDRKPPQWHKDYVFK